MTQERVCHSPYRDRWGTERFKSPVERGWKYVRGIKQRQRKRAVQTIGAAQVSVCLHHPKCKDDDSQFMQQVSLQR